MSVVRALHFAFHALDLSKWQNIETRLFDSKECFTHYDSMVPQLGTLNYIFPTIPGETW